MKDYILGNNGLILPSIVYLYLGASAERLFTLINAKDREVK